MNNLYKKRLNNKLKNSLLESHLSNKLKNSLSNTCLKNIETFRELRTKLYDDYKICFYLGHISKTNKYIFELGDQVKMQLISDSKNDIINTTTDMLANIIDKHVERFS